jgi:hypothetical protein
VTNLQRLLRVDLASGAVTELVPRTPSFEHVNYPGVATYFGDGIGAGS